MNIDIRNDNSEEVTTIQFADRQAFKGVYIVKKANGEIQIEDKDLDGVERGVRAEDIDNFVKARECARRLGWAI